MDALLENKIVDDEKSYIIDEKPYRPMDTSSRHA